MPSTRLHAHDYARLTKRWKALARRSRLHIEPFASSGGHDIFCALPKGPRPGTLPLYLSAGIHGDEPASTEGLVEWAENAADFLRNAPVMIFPCLNPWGLTHNIRFDSAGRDLNRCYHSRAVPQVAAHCRILRGRRFSLALALHEDYDACGAYLYEVRGAHPPVGEAILDAAARYVPREVRRSIEGSRCKNGLVRRKITPSFMKGHPEAFLLHFYHAERTLTLETPSEFCIDDRTSAQVAGIHAATDVFLEISSSTP